MILRKPYAFFIKYFRIINLIMAILMGFLVYKTWNIVSFVREYISDYSSAIINFSINNIIDSYMFFVAFLIIVADIIVLSVLFLKKKPKRLYVFNLILYLLVIVLFFVDYSSLRNVTNTIMDIRASKALRDFTIIGLVLQSISLLMTFIRAVGFDIKRFDFNSDLQKLDIDAYDNEEFEVAVELDTNKTKRNIRKNLREFNYFYVEHRFIIRVIFIITIVFIVFLIAYNRIIYVGNYSENEVFDASNVSLDVLSSYVTNVDDKSLVIVKFDVKSSFDDLVLNTGLFNLRIGNASYSKTDKFNSDISDIGVVYNDQPLTKEFVSYVIAFDIPKENSSKEMQLKFNDDVSYVRGEVGAKNIYVKLKPINLTDYQEQEYILGNEVKFDGSILGNSVLKIDDVSFNDKFREEYDFCASASKCYKSYEYLTPSATGNYFKTLLKIEGSFTLDDKVNIEGAGDILHLLNKYGVIYYKIGDEWYKHKINSQNIRPSVASLQNVTYVEVNRDVLNASKVYLQLNVRNYRYKYDLK